MITGVVTAQREAIVRLTVRGPTGQEEKVDALIDTSFDGGLSVPPALIARLGLPWRSRGRAVLADGSDCIFDIHEATLIWNGQPLRLAVPVVDAVSLIGMALLDGHELKIQVRNGGDVTVEALP